MQAQQHDKSMCDFNNCGKDSVFSAHTPRGSVPPMARPPHLLPWRTGPLGESCCLPSPPPHPPSLFLSSKTTFQLHLPYRPAAHPLPAACRLQYWDSSSHVWTNKPGSQTHLSAYSFPKDVLSKYPHLDILLDTTLLTRWPSTRSTYQWTTNPSHQKVCTSP